MSAAELFIRRLEAIPTSDRCRLRGLAERPLDSSVEGFDLFTGIWWPLRQRNPRVPPREVSWLIAKLFASFPIPNSRHGASQLAAVLGRLVPAAPEAAARFRARFDALLQARLSEIEPHLNWALGTIEAMAGVDGGVKLDWVQLTDDLSAWDRPQRSFVDDVRARWADSYLHPRLTGAIEE